MNQYFKICKRDIGLFKKNVQYFEELIEKIELFQEDKIIISTKKRLMIYNISEKKILVEKKMEFKPNSSDEKIIKIYGKNKFLIFNREHLNILFFELISNKKTNKYLLKQLGLIHVPHRWTKILIKGKQLILDYCDVSDKSDRNKYKKKNLEKFDNKKNMIINNIKVYNLNNFEFILNIDIPFLKDEKDILYPHSYKPVFFTLNNKTLGFFGADNIYNTCLIRFNTFKKSYALNEKKLLNIQHIRLDNLGFMEVKCSNKKNNKFILYNNTYTGFTEFFLYSSKDFKLINVIKCPELLSGINIYEKGIVFGFANKFCNYFYEIGLENNFILNNYIKYNLNDRHVRKILFLEKPQKLFINYDFSNVSNFQIYLAESSLYYIILDILNFIICFFYISIFYKEIYRGNNFPIEYFVIPILLILKIKLNWTLLHFILFNIILFLGIFLKFSVAKGIGLSFLIVLFESVLLICHFLKDFHYKI